MSRFHRHDFPDLPERAFRTLGRRWVGRLQTLEGGKGGGSSAPPPDPRLVEAQVNSLNMQDSAVQQMLDQAKSLQPMQMQQMQADTAAANEATKNAEANFAYATDQRAKLTPLQDQMVKDANTWNAPDQGTKLADQYMADVNQSFGNQQQQNLQAMERMGVNPSSGAALAMNNASGIAEAEAKAQAAEQARTQAQNTGWALTDRAASALGATPALALSSNGALSSAAGTAQNITNAGTSSLMSPLASAAGAAGQAAGTATSAYNGQLNSYVNSQNSLNSENNALLGAVGTVAGGAFGGPIGSALGAKVGSMLSDKNAKTDKVKLKDDDALQAIRKIPVSSWKYKPGRGDGGSHVGPMAQDVQQAAGNAVAPGGKAIDLISANGMNLAAIRALDQKVQRLEAARKGK